MRFLVVSLQDDDALRSSKFKFQNCFERNRLYTLFRHFLGCYYKVQHQQSRAGLLLELAFNVVIQPIPLMEDVLTLYSYYPKKIPQHLYKRLYEFQVNKTIVTLQFLFLLPISSKNSIQLLQYFSTLKTITIIPPIIIEIIIPNLKKYSCTCLQLFSGSITMNRNELKRFWSTFRIYNSWYDKNVIHWFLNDFRYIRNEGCTKLY